MRKSLFACLVLLAALACSTRDIEVYDLRCEGLVEPLAIDSGQPHFSWKINSTEPMEQVAYEIQVEPGLWDSGRIESADQVMVPYGGKPLQSRQLARWRVRVWSSDLKLSLWSDWQRFGVGVLPGDKLQGDYIGAVPGEGRQPLLRKVFTLEQPVDAALLHVNSLGYHEAYVNGLKVSEDVLAPAVSQLDRRALTVTYDVAPLLQQGENELLFRAGSGWYKPSTFGASYAGPLVKAELDIYPDGEAVPAVWTDASWEGAWSGCRDLGTWTPHRFGGEEISLAEPEWGPVDVVKVSGIVASPQMCEPCRVQEILLPRSIEPLGADRWLADFGCIVNAMTDISLPQLPRGHVTRVSFGDFLQDDGTLLAATKGEDVYISSGLPGGDRFEERFNHHVFRYIIFDGLRAAPTIDSVRARRMRTDFEWAGSFESSDPDLNRIHALVSWTMENLAFNGYMVDCASIERLGYGGDGNASTLSLQTVANVAPLYLNWLQAWTDAQRPDGGLPHTAPNPYTAGGGPYWCSFLVQAPWRTWMRYGDPRPVERCYPAMKLWFDYVEAYTVDGLLDRWPNLDYRGWYLGDWAAPKGVNVDNPASIALVNNCALCQSFLEMEQMALMLGLSEDAAEYRAKYNALARRIHQNFFLNEDFGYASGSQVDLAYPLLVGVVPESLRGPVAAALESRTESVYGGHLATGLVGVPVVTEWATRAGACDWLYGLLKKRSYPGYLYMLDNDATGVWEEWDGGRSHLHNCYNGIGSWFYEALGGIVPDAPGCRHLTIAPQIPEGLEWVKVCEETPYGTVVVERNGLTLNVLLPVGVTATIAGNEYGCGSHTVTLVN